MSVRSREDMHTLARNSTHERAGGDEPPTAGRQAGASSCPLDTRRFKHAHPPRGLASRVEWRGQRPLATSGGRRAASNGTVTAHRNGTP